MLNLNDILLLTLNTSKYREKFTNSSLFNKTISYLYHNNKIVVTQDILNILYCLIETIDDQQKQLAEKYLQEPIRIECNDKMLHKYIQDKVMHYNNFRKVYLKEFNKDYNYKPTDYERGYIAGVCHGLKEINRDLTKDNEITGELMIKKIGTGLKWCRIK